MFSALRISNSLHRRTGELIFGFVAILLLALALLALSRVRRIAFHLRRRRNATLPPRSARAADRAGRRSRLERLSLPSAPRETRAGSTSLSRRRSCRSPRPSPSFFRPGTTATFRGDIRSSISSTTRAGTAPCFSDAARPRTFRWRWRPDLFRRSSSSVRMATAGGSRTPTTADFATRT